MRAKFESKAKERRERSKEEGYGYVGAVGVGGRREGGVSHGDRKRHTPFLFFIFRDMGQNPNQLGSRKIVRSELENKYSGAS